MRACKLAKAAAAPPDADDVVDEEPSAFAQLLNDLVFVSFL
jgi:hypothetical protein